MTDDLLDSRGGRLLVSVAAAVAGLAGSYALSGYTPTFVVSPVERALTRAMPGIVVSTAISTLGSLGQQLNLLLAVCLTGLLVALAARAAILTGQAANNRLVPAVGTAALTWGVAVVLTGEVVLAAGPAVAAAAVVAVAQALDRFGGPVAPISSKRRRALSTTGVALGAALLGYAAGERRSPRTTGDDAPSLPPETADVADIQRKLAIAQDASLDLAGMDPLVSERFYEVDINSIDPMLDAARWTLTVTGAVENDLVLTYDDLRAMPAETKYKTLRCVGEGLNARLMSNAVWTAAPIMDLVERAGPRGGCECVMLRAADGYYEEFPLAALREGFLAIGMNGASLPRSHGYPARALIPGHWGEVNVKWLTEIEVLEEEATGYWEERGWHGTGPVNTVAKIWTIDRLGDGRVRAAGHAYAGTRGIERVEVSTDGGETWTDATLSDPLDEVDVFGERDVWRQWQYTWTPGSGGNTITARATDGEGTLQPRENASPFPNGASGWVTRSV